MDLEVSFYLVERESCIVDLGTRLRGPCQVGAGMWWGAGQNHQQAVGNPDEGNRGIVSYA